MKKVSEVLLEYILIYSYDTNFIVVHILIADMDVNYRYNSERGNLLSETLTKFALV